ncbi:putative leader peptide [Streptomyces sp. NPDC048669]|uniref:putative leader peptide n=1 Tax=Streptomyces sp. NPDC048669 TaxID=3155267 RepID=UPI0034387667
MRTTERRPDGDREHQGSADPGVRRAGWVEVEHMRMSAVTHRRATSSVMPSRPRLYSRQHIDLLRVAGALCCS